MHAQDFSCDFFLCDRANCLIFVSNLYFGEDIKCHLPTCCPPPASLLCPQEASPLATLPSVLAVLHSSLFTCHATLQLGCSSRSLFMFVNQVHYGFSSTLVSHLVTCAALLTYQYPKVSLHFSSLDPSFTFLKHLV